MNYNDLREERINNKDHFYIVGDFCCGPYEPLNEYVMDEAFNRDQKGEGNTYLMITNENNKDKVIAYFTLKANQILWMHDEITKDETPVIELSRLAINFEYHRNKLGTYIFYFNILPKVLEVRKYVGVAGILVYADTEQAIGFYKSLGFDDFGVTNGQISTLTELDKNAFNKNCHVLILRIDNIDSKIIAAITDK